MLPITFLEASNHRRLSKVIAVDKTTTYPLIKTVSSHSYELTGSPFEVLSEFASKLEMHAQEGHAYFRGAFTRPLVNEARKGLTDREYMHRVLVFDFDSITIEQMGLASHLTWNSATLIEAAEHIIHDMPEEFKNVSYIARASSSTGRKEKFSFHVFFILDTPMAPRTMKALLRWLNLAVPSLKSQLELTATGAGLSFKLDPCLADNSRIAYIAPPIFVAPARDPFANSEDRQVIVEKSIHQLNASRLVELTDYEALDKDISKQIRNLRAQRGLNTKKEKTTTIRLNDESFKVVTNPDKVLIRIEADEGRYLRCNINNGDSAAYYIDKERPTVVWNFKGDPPFLLEPADSDLFDELMRDLDNKAVVPGQQRRPFVFRDMKTDTLYQAFLDGKGLLNEVSPVKDSSVGDFFKDFGSVRPDVIPQINYEFKPNDPRTVDLENRFINKYVRPDIIAKPIEIPTRFHDIQRDDMELLTELTPTIYKVIHHVCGASKLETGALIRWLSFVVNKRVKSRLSWILHGTEGTGKGILFHRIVTPLLGHHYTSQKNLNDVADTFNDWLGDKLFVMVDEFRLSDTGQTGRISSMLKQAITEPWLTVRGMQKAQRDVASYVNFLFCSNADDSMKFSKEDRRFNVAPRQKTKLFTAYPELEEKIDELIDLELPAFAAALATMDASIEEVSKIILNDAKTAMYVASQRSTDHFASALNGGDLDWFVDFYYDRPLTDAEIRSHLDYKLLIEKLTLNLGNTTFISASDARTMYSRCIGKQIGPVALGRFLGMHGLPQERRRTTDGRQERGFPIRFNLKNYSAEQILENRKTPLADSKIVDFPSQ